MACMLNSESRRLYSWWWDSHISPKNSKWLKENLTDMDAKVKSMIKLIEEDADSFARRAEMYYKKRPELMKLVEEFYRAYRALAERYDYATGELRHAQRTMAAAFPDQVPFGFTEDSSSSVTGKEPQEGGAFFDPEFFLERKMKKGEEKDERHVADLSNENQNLKDRLVSESERADKAECEIQNLKKALEDMQSEKESLLVQYEVSVQKFANADGELNRALEESKKLEEKASEAEKEAQTLKETLQAERAQHLINKLSRSKDQDEAILLQIQYKECVDRISSLEKKVMAAEEDAKVFRVQASRAQMEVDKLTRTVSELNERKEALHVVYAQCLEKICKLELDLSSAQEDVKRLNSEILTRTQKHQATEGVCVQLERSNQSLKLEAGDLAKKIMSKDKELRGKHEELEKLQRCVKDEHTRYVQVETTLETLQNLYTRSQEEQRALALELQNGLQMLKNTETAKLGLEEEMGLVKEENRSLNEQNVSVTVSMKEMETEILELRQMKERLEEEVETQLGQSVLMQKQASFLKEEIEGLKRSYKALMNELEVVGLSPESLGSSVKDLQDENSRLRQMCEKEEGLSQEIENVKELVEKNTALESSLLDVKRDLEGSREKVEELNSSCQLLHGEKSALVLEKTLLMSQLHIITVNMQKLMDKNTALENSLSSANVELECLREKSKGLEEACQLLNKEKSSLVAERHMLAIQLESVEQRLEILEKRFTQFEERYGGLEKEKEAARSQVQELSASVSMEKRERESFMVSNQTRMADLENHIHLLQDESKWKKKECQEELDKAVMAQFENFILQKFIEDTEERNQFLLVECEKHVKASKLADKLISDLETENLEQQVEEELLLVEIENLRLGIYQVFFALDGRFRDEVESEQISIDDILSKINDMKCCLSKDEDDKQRLLVENEVILTLLQQLQLEVQQSELEKTNKYEIVKDALLKAMKENLELFESNTQLALEVNKGDRKSSMLKSELEGLQAKQGALQRAYLELQEEYSQSLQENSILSKDIANLKEENRVIEEECNGIIMESLALGNISTVFRSFSAEKATELRLLSEDLRSLHRFNNDLEKELILLREKLDTTQGENLLAKCTIEELESKLKKTENMNSELGLTMEGVMRKCEETKAKVDALEKETVKLSNNRDNLKKEIEYLSEVNGNLGLEVNMLQGEIEERKIIQENLTSELQERANEFELWDAEATSFYFDFQISNIRDALFENKVHELTGVCASLEGETASKDVEIEEMKEKASMMQSEINGLRAQLLAYTPVVGSLKESVASLEHNLLSPENHFMADHQKPKDVEVAVAVRPHHHHHTTEPESMWVQEESLVPNGISDLMKLQTRITALEKATAKDVNTKPASSETSTKRKSAQGETHVVKSLEDQDHQRTSRNRYLMTKAKPEISQVKKGVPIRDIPLDQASDGSSSTNSRSRSRRGYSPADDEARMLPYEPQIEELGVDKLEVATTTTTTTTTNQQGKKVKYLQKLASDAQKLSELQTTVKGLMKRLGTSKKSKAMGVDFETVKEQLEEVEESTLQLVNVNVESAANVEKNSAWMEQEEENTWKGSERIGRLQMEVQKIQYVLLKLDEEENRRKVGKSRFSSIILRDFIHRGRRGSGRRKKQKNRFCGCFTPSTRRKTDICSTSTS